MRGFSYSGRYSKDFYGGDKEGEDDDAVDLESWAMAWTRQFTAPNGRIGSTVPGVADGSDYSTSHNRRYTDHH